MRPRSRRGKHRPLQLSLYGSCTLAQPFVSLHAFGWHVLQELHRVDPAPWPAGVARRPESEAWSMCFNGMPLFCNMSNPAHRVRRSRHLGGSLNAQTAVRQRRLGRRAHGRHLAFPSGAPQGEGRDVVVEPSPAVAEQVAVQPVEQLAG
ncbi:YqcI/YcgG family protein [Streptomyces sp. NPDC045431]|uniref:YqcI/YcgG family protein n=1 Tax=Streptomyces sp. NPDC045431 TaxID=3155613 RepID=UPI003411454A